MSPTISTTSLGGEERTSELRQRQLAMIIDGRGLLTRSRCPGEPPTWAEQATRWVR